MQKFIFFTFVLFVSNIASADEFQIDEIKISCDCKQNGWTIEKIDKQIIQEIFKNARNGALGETRTPMSQRTADFESAASTSSATRATPPF